MVNNCAVYGCQSTNKNKNRCLYPFPLDETRCISWLQAIERHDLAHLNIVSLHNEYRVCDLHFTFLDHHRILLDNAIPTLNLPQTIHLDYLTKSTQTDFSSVTESTQTNIVKFEIGCQTDINSDLQEQWKIDNPLKRKLLITLAFDPKVQKTDQVTEESSLSLVDNVTDKDPTSDSKEQDSSVAVTCQPDISSIVPKNDPVKPNKIGSQKSVKKQKKSKESKPKQKKKYVTRKPKESKDTSQSDRNESSESEQDEMDYDTMMASRLEEAIKLIQQQWRIHEKKYRKDKTEDIVASEDPIEKLRVKQGRSYGNELKFLALNLFYSNPTAYKALRQHLNLPTEKTLRRIEVGISTKLTPTVLNCLKLIVSKLKEEEKFCVVCANLLPLKEEIHKIANSDKSIGYHEINEVQGTESASKTLVILLKGLYSDWKQPLITCYLKENFDITEVNKWLDEIIMSLFDIGLNVVALTTNENPNFINMAKERNISTERAYFYVNNHKIYYIFDILHLLNSFRNLLLNYYFRFLDVDGTELIASWFDIEKLFETDKTRLYKLAPKLTENHIRPGDLDKTRIQYSAQVFSKTVAAGIINCIEVKHLTTRSFGTVKFVELMNNVFDILNSSDEKELSRYKMPFCFKDYQIDVLDKMLNVLPNLKIITKNYEDITESVETMKCLEITIRSVLNIAADLKTNGYEYLCMRNFNLEYLDAFFESMRRKWGFKATAVLFYAGFRNFFLENVIKKSESNDSCGLDKELIAILLKDNTVLNKEKDFNPYFKYL